MSLKALSFAVVGVVNTLIDLGIFLIGYNVIGLALVPANVLAWIVAVSGSYVMNSFITFAAESGGKLRWRSYGTFVASGVAGVIANTAVLVVASYWIPVIAAKLLAIAVELCGQFFAVALRRVQGASARGGNVGRMNEESCVAIRR